MPVDALEEVFVVNHKAIGQKWTQGDVVPRKEFEKEGIDVNRLLIGSNPVNPGQNPAIRYATMHERNEKKITPKKDATPSHQHEMGALVSINASLRQRIVELENQLNARNMTVMSTEPTKPVADMLRTKEEKIESLQLEKKQLAEENKAKEDRLDKVESKLDRLIAALEAKG